MAVVRIDRFFIYDHAHDLGKQARVEWKERRASQRVEATSRNAAVFGGSAPLFNYVDNGWHWNTHNNAYAGRGWQEEGNKSSYAFWGFLGLCVGVVGAGFSGYFYSNLSQSREKWAETDRLAKTLKTGEWDQSISYDLRRSFEKLVATKLKIDEMIASKGTYYFASASAAFGGGVSLALGAITAAAWAVTVGQVALVVGAVLAAWNFGLHYNDESTLARLYEKVLGNNQGKIGLADSVCALTSPLRHPINYWQTPTDMDPVQGVPLENVPYAAVVSPHKSA